MYDPYLGRFLSVDPAGQFHSPYTYVGNNPVRMVDPNGRFAFTAVAIGMGIAAASYSAAAIGTSTGVIEGDPSRFASTTKFMGAVAAGGAGGAAGQGIGAASAFGLEGVAAGAVNGAASGALSSATKYTTKQALTGEKFDPGDFLEKTGAGLAGGAVSGAVSTYLGGALEGYASRGPVRAQQAKMIQGTFSSASGSATRALVMGDALKNKSFSVPIGHGSVSIGFEPSLESVMKSAITGIGIPYAAGASSYLAVRSGLIDGTAKFENLQFRFGGAFADRMSRDILGITSIGDLYPAPAKYNEPLGNPANLIDKPSFFDIDPVGTMRDAVVGEVSSQVSEEGLNTVWHNQSGFGKGAGLFFGGAAWFRLHYPKSAELP